MSVFRSYTHVERIDRDECDGILQNHIVVQAKLDGSNSLVYSRNGEIYCGSRTRELSDIKDNANFRNYILTSEDAEIAALRKYVLAHPNYIVYGEWLGNVAPYTTKFVGSIKRYLEGGFFIFDVFDVDVGTYLPYHEWEPKISAFYHRVVPLIAEFDNPTNEQIAECIDKNGYNLPDGVLGEGIVIKAEPSFRDKWGNIQIAKIVRDEYKQDKAKPKKVYADGDVEQEFVYKYVTDAFLDKCRNKVLQACGDDVFDYRNKKHMGMMISFAWKDAVEENVFDFVKKKKPIINFGTLNGLVNARVRTFLNL
jgi:hypothetical protein